MRGCTKRSGPRAFGAPDGCCTLATRLSGAAVDRLARDHTISRLTNGIIGVSTLLSLVFVTSILSYRFPRVGRWTQGVLETDGKISFVPWEQGGTLQREEEALHSR